VETTPESPSADTTRATDTARSGPALVTRWRQVLPWAGTVARLVVAVVFLVAGGNKVGDLAASGRAVNAYDVMPVEAGRVVGSALPLVEIALGVLLLLGLATRLGGLVASGLFVVFITGIAQAWARGLSIDCGCFGGDGSLAAGQGPRYLWEILRDTGLLALSVLILVYPRTRLSLDSRLAGHEEIE